MSQAPVAGYPARECFVGAARKASRRLTQFYDDALAPSGLKSTQYSIFSELTRFASPPTLAELASQLEKGMAESRDHDANDDAAAVTALRQQWSVAHPLLGPDPNA